MDEPFALAEIAGAALAERFGTAPSTAVILGSGWQDAAAEIGPAVVEFEVTELRGFPLPTAPGHGRTVQRIDLAKDQASEPHSVAVFLGRTHLFEGHSPARISHVVRTAAAAGVTKIIITNAAGTLRTDRPIGQAVVISDHLNLTGQSPLTGPNPPAPYNGRFVDMTDLYSVRLRTLARSLYPELNDAVYAGLSGPQFETPAEINSYRSLGAEVLGFSTVLEAIAARHLELEVLGISLVTNLCAGMQAKIDDQEVLEAGRAASGQLGAMIKALLCHPDFLEQ